MGAGYGRVVGVNALVEPLDAAGSRWRGSAAGAGSSTTPGLPVALTHGPGTEVRLRHDDRAGSSSSSTRRQADRRSSGRASGSSAARCSDGRARRPTRYDDAGDLDRGRSRRRGTPLRRRRRRPRSLSVTDADGVVEVVNVYDEEGRVVEQLSPFGRRTRYALPARPRHGHRRRQTTARRTPTSTTPPAACSRSSTATSSRMSFNYDEWGNPVVVTERGGAVTIQELDERVAARAPRAADRARSSRFAYDDADRVVEVARVQRRDDRHALRGRRAQPRRRSSTPRAASRG